ncbi:efflux RND transporter periplasmic adaptor subunit [Gallaecimonas sp. GXIMD4217]|uniref:efflux RND transporter periplasmic adaptor subunit n=1 Tax=Gallaecimonas sp. GXIMD4217 TaxID=3131927 RepID=UPI00311B1C6B
MRKLLIFTLILAGFGAILYAKAGRGERGVTVTTAEAMVQDLKRSVLASGQLAYREQVQLRSEVTGTVDAVLVEEGQAVSKGQLLLTLDPQAFQAEVDERQAYVRQSRIAIERQKTYIDTLAAQVDRKIQLYDKGLLDTDAFEAAKSELTLARIDLRAREQALIQAEAALNKAQERLTKTRFIAPMDGVITAVDIKVGETVIQGTTNVIGSSLMTLADPSAILTEVEVDEADIAQVAEGQSANIFAIAFPDEPLEGKVQSIATTARQAKGRQGQSFTVKILLSDLKGFAIRPGMSCRAEIFTETAENALVVPIESVLYDPDEQPYVMRIQDGAVAKQRVKLGLSDDTLQQIQDGIQAGMAVVRGPARTLKGLAEGDHVRVKGD